MTPCRAGLPHGRREGGARRADYALQIVQIDHTPVDVFVVDAVHCRPIQSPWLTLAIDLASRMVAGFYPNLEAPSVSQPCVRRDLGSTPFTLEQLAEWRARSV